MDTTQVIADFKLHPVDFREKAGRTGMVVVGIGLHLSEVCHLRLEARAALHPCKTKYNCVSGPDAGSTDRESGCRPSRFRRSVAIDGVEHGMTKKNRKKT